jgi:hypothetical protein
MTYHGTGGASSRSAVFHNGALSVFMCIFYIPLFFDIIRLKHTGCVRFRAYLHHRLLSMNTYSVLVSCTRIFSAFLFMISNFQLYSQLYIPSISHTQILLYYFRFQPGLIALHMYFVLTWHFKLPIFKLRARVACYHRN